MPATPAQQGDALPGAEPPGGPQSPRSSPAGNTPGAGARGAHPVARALVGRAGAWSLLVLWVILAGVGGMLAGKLTGAERNNQASFLPKSAPSTRAAVLDARFPGAEVIPAVVVYAAPGSAGPADRALVEHARGEVVALPLAASGHPSPVVVSPNGRVLTFSVPISATASFSTISSDVGAIRGVVGSGSGGLTAAVTGPAASDTDLVNVFANIDTKLLLATVLLVAVLLVLIYRSPFLWLVPLAVVGIAAAVSQAAVYALARAGFTVNGETVGILTVLVFGAGTDYALLLIARYREELSRHADHRDALAFALSRAEPSILTSAGTVIVALLCLSLAERSDVAALGPVSAAGIACALLAMVSLLPALLAVLGRRVFWPFVPVPDRPARERESPWARLAGWLPSRRRLVWVAGVVVLAGLAVGTVDLRPGQVAHGGLLGNPGSVQGQTLLALGFPPGATAPASVVGPASEARAARLATIGLPGVAAVGPAEQAGDLARFSVTLDASPASGPAQSTVVALRDRLARAAPAMLVGGETATKVDLRAASDHDLRLLVPLILVVVLVGLGLLLRAVVAPLVLTASVVLSFLAALGVSSLVFVHLLGFGGSNSSLPILGFLFLVALGVDYTVFLMARVREEAARGTTAQAVQVGLAATGAVITSAGVVLAGTFAVLGILPLVELAELGFLVAFGVLLDTFVVRSLVVPALAMDLGDRLWWPNHPRSDGARRGANRAPTAHGRG